MRPYRGLLQVACSLGTAFGVVAGSSGLLAQAVPQPTTPQGLPSRAQIEQPAPQPAPEPTTVSVQSHGAIATPPCALEGSPVRVVLTSVRFSAAGRPAVPPAIAAMLAHIGPATQGEQPIANVCRIRDAANAALQRAGFVASVQIPPQEIADGVLELNVVTARITEIRIHGETEHFQKVLERVVAQIKALDPLNERDAERILLIAGDVPGLSVQLALRPAGTAPGDVIGDLTITSHRYALLGNFQNYGSRELGRETLYARGELYGLVAPGDTFYVGGSTTGDFKEQQVVQTGYYADLGGRGATLGGRFTYAWSKPSITGLDLRSISYIGAIEGTVPLVRSVQRNLSLTGGLEIIEQKTRVDLDAGSVPFNLDRLRVFFLRANASMRQVRPDGLDGFTYSGSVEFRRGADILGASTRGDRYGDGAGYTLSRFDGDPEAFVIRADGDVMARLNRIFSVAANLRGQWSNHPLLNFEEYSIGNLTVGLGYDPGATSADRAIGLHSEARADLNPESRIPIQLFGFTDNVWIWNLDHNTTETDRRLSSAGGGARAVLPGLLLLEVTYAHPFDRALSFDKHRAPDRLLVSLTAHFSPLTR